MSKENQNMDDSFKKMSEDLNVSYNKSFWEDARADLENDALDNAFRDAAALPGTTAGMDLASESLGDAFMDDAFQEAAEQVSATYSNAYWTGMEAAQPDLEMDEAFLDASKELKASYSPAFWGAANSALEKEGLHHEYNATYWNEAKTLLDNADRKSFFTKWTGLAGVLLLVSLLGVYVSDMNNATSGQQLSNEVSSSNQTRPALHKANQIENSDALVQFRTDQANQYDQNELINSENASNNSIDANLAFANTVYDSNNAHNEIVVKDENNEFVSAEEQNIESDVNGVDEVANPSGIEPNPQATHIDVNSIDQGLTNEFGNTYNPLDRQNENTNSVQNTQAINGNQENRSMQTEYINTDKKSEKLKNETIEKLTLPRAVMAFNILEMPPQTFVNVDAPRLKNVHTFSILAGVGKGIGYGAENKLWTNRIYAGLAYNTRGFGKLRKFEFGGNVLLNYSDHEDLRQEKTEFNHLYNTLKEINYVKVNVSQLYYLNANINASYEFVSKHKLRLGMGLSRVVSANSNVASNFRGKKENNDYVYLGSQFDISNGGNKIPDGLNQIDLSFTLGYEFQISRRFSIQVTGKYGLYDRTNNLDFRNNNISSDYHEVYDNERNVTVGLKYNLFRATK